LIAQPPLLAVMRGGEFAFLKMALTWTAVPREEGWTRH
jgi:hypothetical protein